MYLKRGLCASAHEVMEEVEIEYEIREDILNVVIRYMAPSLGIVTCPICSHTL